jgi:hypothetical protein
MNFNQPARNLLDSPMMNKQADPRGLAHVLQAVETVGGRDWEAAGREFSAHAEGRSIDATLRAMGGIDVGRVRQHVEMCEAADRISGELLAEEAKLLESAPPIRVDGDPFVRAKKLSARYQGPEGRQNFALDSEADPELVVHLEEDARRARARQTSHRQLNRIAATVNDPDIAIGQKIRTLEAHRSAGVKELQAVTGNTRQMVAPSGTPGELRQLEATIHQARVIAIQVDDRRAATPTSASASAGVDGDVQGAVERLHRRLQAMVNSPAVDNYGLTDQINDFHRRLGGVQ